MRLTMGETSIEWTDRSVNPIRMRSPNGKSGHYCEKTSPGCKNCYSSRFQPRVGLPQFQDRHGQTDGLYFDAANLEEVLRRRKPTKWFWCDMTDMFGDWVPFEWIAACFGVMAATPWHTHQILTKWPHRALEFFEWLAKHYEEQSGRLNQVVMAAYDFCHQAGVREPGVTEELRQRMKAREWPLPNVWLGVSTDNQATADERIPLLLQCPAAVRFVSAEPLLGPVDFSRFLPCGSRCGRSADHASGRVSEQGPFLDWIIVGGES